MNRQSLLRPSERQYRDVRLELRMRSTPSTRALVDRLIRRLVRERPNQPIEHLSSGDDLHIIVHIPPEWRDDLRAQIYALADDIYA